MGMAGAQLRTLREALAMGQTFCPACIAFTGEDGNLAWSREEDAYYHASSFCAGVEDEAAEAETALTFVARARLQGQTALPELRHAGTDHARRPHGPALLHFRRRVGTRAAQLQRHAPAHGLHACAGA